MTQVTVTLVFASIGEAAIALSNMGKPSPAAVISVTPADSKPTAAVVQPVAAVPEKKVEPSTITPKAVTVEVQTPTAIDPAPTPVDPAALTTALQNFAKRDNAAFSALMKQHGLKNMLAVAAAAHLHAELMAAATSA